MFKYRGFLAEAAKKAAKEARAKIEKRQKKNLDRMIKEAKRSLLATSKERENIEHGSDIQTRLMVMKAWNEGCVADSIADIVDLSSNHVSKLFIVFESLKSYSYSKKNVDINELVEVSGFTEFEVKTFLMLLK